MRERDKTIANDDKQALRVAAKCLCVVCGEYLPHDLFDLGHRVSKGKSMREKWGDDVIFHPMNMLPVCHGTKAGKSCNDQCNMKYLPGHELLQRIIRINTGREAMPNIREYYAELRREFEEKRK